MLPKGMKKQHGYLYIKEKQHTMIEKLFVMNLLS